MIASASPSVWTSDSEIDKATDVQFWNNVIMNDRIRHIRCKNCNIRVVPTAASACPKCGRAISDSVVLGSELQQEFKKWARSQLPRLGNIRFKCPSCKQFIEKVQERCPNCKRVVLSGNSFGHRLADSAGPFILLAVLFAFGVALCFGSAWLKFHNAPPWMYFLGFFLALNVFGAAFKSFISAVSSLESTEVGRRYFHLGNRYLEKSNLLLIEAVMAYSKGIALGGFALDENNLAEGVYYRAFRLWEDYKDRKDIIPDHVSAAYRDILLGAFLFNFPTVYPPMRDNVGKIVRSLAYDESSACVVARLIARNNPHWLGTESMRKLHEILGGCPTIAANLTADSATYKYIANRDLLAPESMLPSDPKCSVIPVEHIRKIRGGVASYKCPHCSEPLESDRTESGRVSDCPVCGEFFRLPPF